MAGWLVMFVAGVYFLAVCAAFLDGDWKLGLMLTGWTIGNIGAALLAWR